MIVADTATIGSNVSIGENTVISDHVVIRDNVTIGDNCKVYPYAVIGEDPQDFSFSKEKSFVEIGDGNIIREFVTIHRAVGEGEKTIIGDNNMLMVYSHVAHNCKLANNIVMANNVQIGGHSVIEDYANIGGTVAIHQNCHVGKRAMVSGMSATSKDLPPYFMYMGTPAVAVGINRIGLQRAEVPQEAINELFKAFKVVYKSGLSIQNAVAKLEAELKQYNEIKELVEFIKSSKRGIKTSR